MKVISEIYDKSCFLEDVDLYRIKDICNSLEENQWEAKSWLVKELSPFIKDQKVVLLGGWYGLIGRMLREKGFENEIFNIELDQGSKWISQRFIDNNFKTIFSDALSWLGWQALDNDLLIISTSIEHFYPEDVEEILELKGENQIVCFQSNDWSDLPTHINCSDSLEDFVNSLNLKEVLFSGQMDCGEYNRFMVIGK